MNIGATNNAMDKEKAKNVPLDLSSDRRFATTLARGLSVLRAFRASDDGLSNAEIAERTNIPKSTISRLTFTLQALGYLTHARRHDRYRPGPALLALGNVASASISFIELAAPIMQKLADATGVLGLILVRDKRKMLVVKTFRPKSVASLWLEVGHRLPIRGTSSGTALLAAANQANFQTIVSEADGYRDLSMSVAKQIRETHYNQLMADGFVIADPDTYYSPNVRAVSVPYHAEELAEPVIFSCGATPDVLSIDKMQHDVGPALKLAVNELEMMTGQRAAITRRNT